MACLSGIQRLTSLGIPLSRPIPSSSRLSSRSSFHKSSSLIDQDSIHCRKIVKSLPNVIGSGYIHQFGSRSIFTSLVLNSPKPPRSTPKSSSRSSQTKKSSSSSKSSGKVKSSRDPVDSNASSSFENDPIKARLAPRPPSSPTLSYSDLDVDIDQEPQVSALEFINSRRKPKSKGGDFTDLSAASFDYQHPPQINPMNTTLSPPITLSSSNKIVPDTGSTDAVQVSSKKASQPVDLGLDQTSRHILSSRSPDIITEYTKLKDYSEAEMRDLKSSQEQVPVSGSWEMEDLTARRVRDILTMPVLGPSPFYRGRNPTLFTEDEAAYFDKYPRTTKNYNKFIWSLSKTGKLDKAKHALEQMKVHNVPIDVGIYTSLILGCLPKKDPKEAMRLFVEMKKQGIQPDIWVFDTIMEVFIAAGELEGAFALYDELKPNGIKPTTIIFTTLVKGCILDKDIDRAWKVYDHMRVWHCEPDEVMQNLMIHACALRAEAEKAFNIYQDMKAMGIKPTNVTFNALLFACVRRKDYYKQAFDLLREMKVEGYVPDHRTMDMLLAVAGKGGDVETAELIFDEIMSLEDAPKKEQPYAFMMEAYAMSHRVHAQKEFWERNVQKAEQVFDRMVAAGIKPTVLSLNLRLNVYTFFSKTRKAVEWKNSYRSLYGVEPDVYTYNSLIEMFGRNRKMDFALDMFNLMKAEGLQPTFTTYSMLIDGCTRNHLVNTGMKLLREMKAKNIDITPEHTFVINFRRQLVKTPDLIREIDQMTGKAYRYVMPWRRRGNIKKISYRRELTPEERKRTSLYG